MDKIKIYLKKKKKKESHGGAENDKLFWLMTKKNLSITSMKKRLMGRIK
jgi:hypothetical protein